MTTSSIRLALLLALALARPATAVEVALLAPEPGVPAFGWVTVAAEVYPDAEAAMRVEVFVDGLLQATAERPPWRFEVDLGDDNVGHVIEVVALPRDPSAAPGSARLRTPAVRSDLEVDADLRQLYLAVEGPDGRRVALGRDQLTVLDGGVSQRIVTYEQGDVPFTAVLLVDASRSMADGKLDTALAAVRRFAAAMGPLDEAKLLLFSDRVLLESPTTGLVSLLTLGLGAVRAQGGTAIHDAIYLALKRLEARQGRKVIVLLSDGIDVDSAIEMADVRFLARRSPAALYWIRPGTGPRAARWMSSWRSQEQHADAFADLERTVEESGGRIIPVSGIPAVDAAFAELLAELRAQLVVGYYPSHRRGSGTWHPIEVTTHQPGVRLRTRAGYLED